MSKKIMSKGGGIGESKIFAAENEEKNAAHERMLECHINGVAIRELNLEPQVLAALDYWATDEGIEEKNSRPNVRPDSGVRLGADAHDKSLQQRRDDVIDRGMELYEARDPLKEVADRHAQPGMKPKFLSSNKVKDLSGAGDYSIVKDSNGDPVRVRGLVLGHVPEERAAARNRHYRDKGNQLLKQLGEQYKREGGDTAVADQ
jgi:hypothetical protein